MNVRLAALAAALLACSTPAWATTSNVGMYGTIDSLPTHETYSAAADVGTNFFSVDPTYTQLLDITSTPGATAQISGAGYAALASTTFGSNHAYANASTTPSNILAAGGFSGWYDQVTISGGTGAGTAHFTVQLSGTVDVGAMAGGLSYTLGSSSVHPSQLTSELIYFNATNTSPWPMDAVNPIATYLLGASPYYDTSILFSDTSTSTSEGTIPAISDPSLSLGGDTGMGFPPYDLVLTPGAGQNIDITLHGTLTFTYGESFYLIGGLGATVFGEGLESFCTFDISGTCTPPTKDGAGATTLDFSNSANLINIALPEGASASFASGTAYNVTAVPEPGEWMLLLAGLGLIAWRTRRRSA
jgi:hypothetical protein